ncbi:MATE family efflux transporter [Thermoactinomyces vulgaris]|jgi:putative MATE family efflux protein|uniref:MATE family efflux transporter n=1 Tax=Thermoactinomyces TaxID=2023 RepID=UPI0011079748|nr:MATE family efflux transporter [Thermoactinomyces vulgaris]MCF6134075.1 MATE family efflux transporter [Thermoactinomyces vulgaris]QCV55868.1 MATE family efflux transporter [Thermoactinomyces vulgaris]
MSQQEQAISAKKIPETKKEHSIDFSLPIWKTMIPFLIPLIFSNALQSLGGTVSSVLIGKQLGENALAAASTVFPLTFFLISFVIGLGSASSVLIGQAFGSGNTEKMKETVGTSLTFSFILGVISLIIGWLFSDQLLSLMGISEEIKNDSSKFMHVLFLGLPFLFPYVIYTTLLRGTGDSKTPFYFLIVSTSLTILLTPLFLFGWGVPQMGLEGAALAQIIASLVTFILLILYLFKVRHPLALDRDTLKMLKLNPQILRLMVKIGLPTSIQMVVISVSELAIVTFVNHFGAKATAAYGVINQVINYVHIPSMSLSIAVGIFGAQLIGANLQEKLTELIKTTVWLNYVVGGFLTILIYVFSRPILSMFLTDPSTIDITQKSLFFTLWAFTVLGHAVILSGLMRSSGTVFWPTTIIIATIILVEIPCAFVFSRLFGLYGVWMAYPVSYFATLLGQYIYYRKYWKGKRHQQFFEQPEPANG